MSEEYQGTERRISILENSYSYLKQSFADIVDRLDKILEQNTKVAVLAEKQIIHQIDLEKASLRIDHIEKTHTLFATKVTEFMSFIEGITKLAYILWTSLGAIALISLIKVVFFLH